MKHSYPPDFLVHQQGRHRPHVGPLGLGAFLLLALVSFLMAFITKPANRLRTPLAQTAPATPKLNVLLVVSDDLGTQLSCYGDKVMKTPNLDQLAVEGTRFSKAYVTQASFSPSRSSMLTGLYPHQNGQIGLAYKGSTYEMKAGVQTLPTLLKAAGYRTGILGKLHVYPESAFRFATKETWFFTNDVQKTADRAKTFFTASTEPFFLMVNYNDPHRRFRKQVAGLPATPLTGADVPTWYFQSSVNGPGQRDSIAGYYNGVKRIDEGVGMLMQALKAAGKDHNTLVIFLGDHGSPFARSKQTNYEAGVRVPFLVRLPGQGRPNFTSNALISTVDIVPTVLDATGVAIPAGLAGRSFKQVLNGPGYVRRDALCTEYTSHIFSKGYYFPRRTVTDGRYKLIVNLLPGRVFGGAASDNDNAPTFAAEPRYNNTLVRTVFNTLKTPPAEELYDLNVDPFEFTNLAGQTSGVNKEKQDELRAKLLKWRQDTQDPLLDPAQLKALTDRHDNPGGTTPVAARASLSAAANTEQPAAASLHLEVSPNPTSGVCTVTGAATNGRVEICVVDVRSGRVIALETVAAEGGFRRVYLLKRYGPGVYVVKARSSQGQVQSRRLVVE
ncbi:sulfatase-like hydrolase/transferase [Hymenobacter weizhouensis]|uniref:sulfatase-like hydrolase/transferase n=1 Tax=Hymenobacter sp. YIM 151500-1 TaxID=2987689 RepID=UPI002226336A|nr:sulfatase-like hydrolase/transferase [Hymenobacter sp. YIM 151500-1]UYZ63511.1 sulfatase-like hydrolase/transferase [Hymenobacter sp. YIM 151500-1]